MLGDIASGNTELADLSFLVALILFAVAVIGTFVEALSATTETAIGYAGLGFLALGLLVL